jgi:hypothetical protein
MTEYSASDSFVVRVYRFDTDDYRKIVGLVETMDETGEKEPFAHIDELAAILNHRVAATQKGNERVKKRKRVK